MVSIAALGILAYSNSFHAPFTFDDETSIVNNELVRDLGNYLSSWTGYHSHPTRYVGNLTFALNYRFGGLDATGYHVVNVLVHILNALLVYALVQLTFRTPHLAASTLASSSRAVAFVAASLFVAHPIQTQAVTYLVQRFTSLATTFYLLTVVQYACFRLAREERRERNAMGAARYAALIVTAIVAMKTKEIAFTLPLAIALYEICFFQAEWKRRLALLAPLLATLAVIPASVLGFHKPIGEVLSEATQVSRVQTTVSRLDYLRTQLAVVATYLRLLVLPVNQNVDYDYPLSHSFLEPRVALSLLLVLAMAAVALWLYGGPFGRWTRRPFDAGTRLVSFGFAWFFLALLVESSIIPIADVIFEHRVYLPSVGLFVAAATAAAFLAQRIAPAHPSTAVLAAGVLVSLAFGAAAFRRNEVWATELSLWTDVVRKSPGKSRPHDNLGLALAKLDREPEAMAQFLEAIRADPRNVRAHNNLGVALAKLGRPREAAEAFLTVLSLMPDNPEAYYNLGRIRLTEEGGIEEAAALLEQAIRLRRNYPQAYANLAAAWNALGRHADVVKLLEGTSAGGGKRPEAHYHLGLAYFSLGNRVAADREYRILLGLSPILASRLGAEMARRSEP